MTAQEKEKTMTTETNSETPPAADKTQPVVVRRPRFAASYDSEFRADVSFVLKVQQAESDRWRWWLHDMDSQSSSIPEAAGEEGNEKDAKHECRMAVVAVLRREAEKIENIADRLRNYDGVIQWS